MKFRDRDGPGEVLCCFENKRQSEIEFGIPETKINVSFTRNKSCNRIHERMS